MITLIYLDNAATSGKKPLSVIQANNYALCNYSSNPGRSGHSLSVKTAEEVFKCRGKIKELFNAYSENNVCFTLNCTYAINMVLNGNLKTGDHLIISSLEHNAVYRPAMALRKENGVEVDIADVDLYDNNKTLENIMKLIKPNTKMIFVTAASNVIGRVLPLKKIGELCRENNILFGVDGAQGAGILDMDMKEMNIDYLCIAPHKGLYAPMGVGILVAQKPITKVIISGGTGVNSFEEKQPDDLPERIESGTLNVPGIIATGAGIDFINQKTIKNIYKHELNLCRYVYKKLKLPDIKLYAPCPEFNEYAPVISFNIQGMTSEEVGLHLNKFGIAVRSGIHCAPLAHRFIGTAENGTVRISPSLFTSYEDIDKLIFVIKRLF